MRSVLLSLSARRRSTCAQQASPLPSAQFFVSRLCLRSLLLSAIPMVLRDIINATTFLCEIRLSDRGFSLHRLLGQLMSAYFPAKTAHIAPQAVFAAEYISLTARFLYRVPAAAYARRVPQGANSMALRYLPQPCPLHPPVRRPALPVCMAPQRPSR